MAASTSPKSVSSKNNEPSTALNQGQLPPRRDARPAACPDQKGENHEYQNEVVRRYRDVMFRPFFQSTGFAGKNGEQAGDKQRYENHRSSERLSADAFLVEESTNTNGFINVGRDEIANTTTLDFSYATPDLNDPEIVYLIQGVGEIPNSAFTTTSTTAHLAVTTPFPSHRCVVNIITAVFECSDSTPITFDLTWVKNGFGSIEEKTPVTQTFGPVTIKFKGEYESITMTTHGTWTGHTAANLFGNLVDSKNNTNLREITLAGNP